MNAVGSRAVILLSMVCLLAMLMARPALSQEYTVTNLGTLGNGSIQATLINASGQVVGEAYNSTGTHSFLWQSGMMTDLGVLPGFFFSNANAVNSSGQIVGYSDNPNTGEAHAFLWQNGKMTDLTPPDFSNSDAFDINASGQIVGEAFDLDNSGNISEYHAFLWQNGKMSDLTPPGFSNSFASSINTSGQIVGAASSNGVYQYHAFLWQNGKMTDLGTLSGLSTSAALSINASGQVIGEAYILNSLGVVSVEHAFLWQNGKMSDLTPPSFSNSEAESINASGQIVGAAYSTVNSKYLVEDAFLWQNGTATDLNDLIPANSGWTLIYASSINDRGQIVGEGAFQGQARAFLLTPTDGSVLLLYNINDQAHSDGALITWNTNLPASSIVEYGKTTAYGGSGGTTSLVTSHSLTLSGLSPSTLYHYRVSSTDQNGKKLVSADRTFVTWPAVAVPSFAYSNLRRNGNVYTVDITLTNVGDMELINPRLLSALLAAHPPSHPSLPLPLNTLGPGASETFTLDFPATVGTPGTHTVLSITGVWGVLPLGAGRFNDSFRVTLP